eukprot:TRINITY_DN1869_c0_g1_i1.p1 TRINITY_DN1869_c0_g1~~TRINITY_DN1869_c0_g1_i1.p1  ORF type:complete len:525 (+),score=204.20 TRINITY_DN1869_c0_g1_i1:67-1641(+)
MMLPAARKKREPAVHFDPADSENTEEELARLQRRVSELEDIVQLEKLKNALPDTVVSQGTVTPDILSPMGCRARAPPKRYMLSSEVLVIIDEERRVPTTLADLMKDAAGRDDKRDDDTPKPGTMATPDLDDFSLSKNKKGAAAPPPAPPQPPSGYPLDRIMTEQSLLKMKSVLALQPIPPTALDAFGYVTDCYDKDSNTFRHDDAPYFLSLIRALCTETASLLEEEPLYRSISSPCYVFGDIHGNFSDLSYFLDNIINFRDLQFTPSNLLFLGDYVDRGPFGLECVLVLLSLKLGYPGQVTLLRGNHEDPLVNGDVRHYGAQSFKAQCLQLFGNGAGQEVWELVNDTIFRNLPLCAEIDKKIFCSHGGIPRFAGGSDQRLRKLKDPNFPRLAAFAMFDAAPPDDLEWVQLATDLTWSDPKDDEASPYAKQDAIGHGFYHNTRGPGTIAFGRNAVETFLQTYGFEYIFRAHQEKSDGLRLSKSARVVTIFSTSDYEGHRNGAGMIFVSHMNEIRLVIKKAHSGPL